MRDRALLDEAVGKGRYLPRHLPALQGRA